MKVLCPLSSCFRSLFGVHGNCSAKIRCDPNFCTAVRYPYTLRPLTGLHGEQMDDILLYMAGDGARIAGLHAKATLLRQDPPWKKLYLHGENTLIHPSRRMFMGRQGLARSLLTPPPPRDTGRKAVWNPVVPMVCCSSSERA